MEYIDIAKEIYNEGLAHVIMRILIVCHLQAGAHGNHCYSSSPNLKAKELEEPDRSPGLNPKNQDQRCQCLRAKIKCPSSSRNQIHSSSAFYSI